jgi:hypothetical protein
VPGSRFPFRLPASVSSTRCRGSQRTRSRCAAPRDRRRSRSCIGEEAAASPPDRAPSQQRGVTWLSIHPEAGDAQRRETVGARRRHPQPRAARTRNQPCIPAAVVSNAVSNRPVIPLARPKSGGIIIRVSGFESLLRHGSGCKPTLWIAVRTRGMYSAVPHAARRNCRPCRLAARPLLQRASTALICRSLLRRPGVQASASVGGPRRSQRTSIEGHDTPQARACFGRRSDSAGRFILLTPLVLCLHLCRGDPTRELVAGADDRVSSLERPNSSGRHDRVQPKPVAGGRGALRPMRGGRVLVAFVARPAVACSWTRHGAGVVC